jgi:replicative DNA helicase
MKENPEQLRTRAGGFTSYRQSNQERTQTQRGEQLHRCRISPKTSQQREGDPRDDEREVTRMTREEARKEINRRPELVLSQLQKSKGSKQYICPICGSGSRGGRDSDGALTFYSDSNRFKCFACSDEPGTFGGKGQDTLGALCLLWSCSETEVFDREGLTIDSSNTQRATRSAQSDFSEIKMDKTPPTTEGAETASQELTEAADLTAYFAECRERLKRSPEAISYLQARGITLDTALQFWIGFDPAADPAQSNHPTPRLITPTCRTHYAARSIDPDTPSKWAKMNNKGGRPAIFNAKVLQDSSTEAVFVTEGFFDALSIIEVGGQAIALNSTSNASKLLEQLREKRTAATLILCFDNDDAGKKCTKTLREGLQRLNISYVTADLCGGYNDPNEALQGNRERFTAAVNEAIRTTAARPDNISDYIDNLMSGEIDSFKEAKNRHTGFADLDEKAKGLYAGLYVIAAISSLGKTTFALNVADNLAEAGEDVLFFSLEQSRLELVSKSLARKTAQKDITTAVNSLSIRRGYLPEQVLTAADEYKKGIADRLSIIEGNFACNISFIGDYIRRYIAKTGKKPIVFIDYLQILQPEQDERGRTQTTKETVDSTVTELKRLSREQGLTIFVISSVNRANYLTPIDFESLKESGGIEYTCDVLWGLQLQVLNDPIFDSKEKIKQKRQKVKAAKAASPRKIELVCLKNRYGVSSYSAYFDYTPEFDLFTEGKNEYETEQQDEQQDKPKRCKRL